VGELVARGSNIAKGYWRDPEGTRERFGPRPHTFRTGDLGYMDEDGFLFLVGRRNDMIKVGGRRVGAKEIEDVLHEHPAVHEAAVVAMTDDLLGEVPVAFVVLRDGPNGIDADSIVAFCGTRLPRYKLPARVVFRDELPKLPDVGKPDRTALRAIAAAAAPLSASG
jgi:long-chain acyl-CoA synthetase